jgi:hypothetical protein
MVCGIRVPRICVPRFRSPIYTNQDTGTLEREFHTFTGQGRAAAALVLNAVEESVGSVSPSEIDSA